MLGGLNGAISDLIWVLRNVRRLGLFKYFLLPGLISLVLVSTVSIFAYSYADDLGRWITGWYDFEIGKRFMEIFGTIVSAIIMLTIVILPLKYILLIVLSPFMSLLSDSIARKINDSTFDVEQEFRSNWLKEIIRGIRISIRNLSKELFYTFILFLLSLTGILSPITSILIFLVQAYYAGFGNMDFTMERHFNIKQATHFVRQNRMYAIGSGAIFLFLLMIPFFGVFLALPLATASSTVGITDVLRQEAETL